MDKQKLYRGNIEGYPVTTDTETDRLIQEIIQKTSQISINKADEVAIMQSMLNDADFSVAVFDPNKGYVGSHSPRADAIGLAIDTLTGTTGMSSVEAYALTENYEFTKRDATRFINLGKDFFSTYLQTGRKVSLDSADPRAEIIISLKDIEERDKCVPDKDNPGKVKTVRTPESIKLVSETKRSKK